MTARTYAHEADYDNPAHDERQERTSVSEEGRRRFDRVGGCWTPGAWGGDDA